GDSGGVTTLHPPSPHPLPPRERECKKTGATKWSHFFLGLELPLPLRERAGERGYTHPMLDISLALIVSATTLVVAIALIFMMAAIARRQVNHPESLARVLEDKHMVMIKDLNAGLNSLGDRLNASQIELFDRLRNTITQELTQTRSIVGAL